MSRPVGGRLPCKTQPFASHDWCFLPRASASRPTRSESGFLRRDSRSAEFGGGVPDFVGVDQRVPASLPFENAMT
jgi:hypothetical protein